MSAPPRVRLFAPDDVAEVTSLLHRAYRELADRGLNFTAATQDEETTLSRATHGMTWLAQDERGLIGCITITFPPSRPLRALSRSARRPGFAWLNQLAVDPTARSEGLGTLLWRQGERWAREQRVPHMGLDTALPATHLIELYHRWGFEQAETIHWPGKTYDSVVMIRDISAGDVAHMDA